MRAKLLVVNHAYLFFGATLYAGVLWGLHFFWYPSWQSMTLDSVQAHFVLPTSAATRFFWVVVPLMFLANAVMIVTEWKTPLRWASLVALACVSTASFVGQELIIPINRQIAAGITDAGLLDQLLKRWMTLNDIRWVVMTLMWLTLMFYFVKKGNLLDALEGAAAPSNP